MYIKNVFLIIKYFTVELVLHIEKELQHKILTKKLIYEEKNNLLIVKIGALSRISGLRNGMNKRTFYNERKMNNRCFDFLSKQDIIVPLILDINEAK